MGPTDSFLNMVILGGLMGFKVKFKNFGGAKALHKLAVQRPVKKMEKRVFLFQITSFFIKENKLEKKLMFR